MVENTRVLYFLFLNLLSFHSLNFGTDSLRVLGRLFLRETAGGVVHNFQQSSDP